MRTKIGKRYSVSPPRFLYAADVVVVMEGGAIANIGPPSAVLPQVEKQMLEEREGREEDKKVEDEAKSEEQQNQVGQDLTSKLFHCHHSLLSSESFPPDFHYLQVTRCML